ncbi:MAG: polysaccharide deacetylase family protein [Blastocatellia bacterium]
MKSIIFTLLHTVGLTWFAAWWNRRQVRILCYHGVTRRTERIYHNPHGLHVRYNRFVAHLDYLQRHYRVISLNQYLAAKREGRQLPDYSVILTFDDGYRNFLTVIAPALAERKMPASVFLITDRIRERRDAKLNGHWTPVDDESSLSWTEAQTLQRQQNIEFGSHTCSHAELPSLSSQETGREIRDSYAAIVSNINNREVALAYPRGKYSDSIVEQARAVGYACALTTDVGINDMKDDPFKLKRILIGDDDDLPAFAARVSGLARWLKLFHRSRIATKS